MISVSALNTFFSFLATRVRALKTTMTSISKPWRATYASVCGRFLLDGPKENETTVGYRTWQDEGVKLDLPLSHLAIIEQPVFALFGRRA